MYRLWLGSALAAMLLACSSDSNDTPRLTTGGRVCADDGECGGMDCEHISVNGNVPDEGICVKHCGSDPASCPSGTQCVSGDTIGLEASCLQVCTTSCPTAMSCVTYGSGSTGGKACLPTSWTKL